MFFSANIPKRANDEQETSGKSKCQMREKRKGTERGREGRGEGWREKGEEGMGGKDRKGRKPLAGALRCRQGLRTESEVRGDRK